MHGGVDRGGGREGKGKSLRKNKQEIEQKVKAQLKGHTAASNEPEVSAPPPPVRSASDGQPSPLFLVDGGVQLINRQFDRDQLKVLHRAATCGVHALVAWSSDFEKLDALLRLAKENIGFVYCMVGVHSDMIKRNNDKLSVQRMEQLKEAALRPEALAIMAGLDFSRDMGIRYAQERALQQQMELAVEVHLPLVLYQVSASEALADKIQELREQQQQAPKEPHPDTHTSSNTPSPAAGTRIAIYNSCGSEAELSALVDKGCHVMVSGRMADPVKPGQALRAALLAACPLGRLLVCSDAPYATPQNIEDAHMREGRNEPSNLPYLVQALAGVYGLREAEMAARLAANAMEFFGLQREHGKEEAAAPGAAAAGQAVSAKEDGRIAAEGAEGVAGEQRAAAGEADAEEGGEGQGGRRAGPGLQAGGDVAEELEKEPGSLDAGDERTARQRRQPEAAPVPKKATARSYLPDDADPSSSGARVAYACRSCRSVLFTELDVRPHVGAADAGQAKFRKSDKAKSKGKQRSALEDQLCSLHFLRAPLPWMNLPTAPLPAAPTTPLGANEGTAVATDGADVEGGAQGEGRLDCPCCSAKLGRYNLVQGMACSCGAEVPAPAVGVLRARLDLLDGGLDLARAVQSALRLYEDAAGDGGDGTSDSDNGEQGERKKKRKQVKGRGNTSNMGNFRNKTFGQPAKPKAKAQGSTAAAEHAGDGGSSGDS